MSASVWCIWERLDNSPSTANTQCSCTLHTHTTIHHIIIAELAFCYQVLIFAIYDSAFRFFAYTFSFSLAPCFNCFYFYLNTCHSRNVECNPLRSRLSEDPFLFSCSFVPHLTDILHCIVRTRCACVTVAMFTVLSTVWCVCLRICTSRKFVYATRVLVSGASFYIDQANVVSIRNLLASIFLFVGEGYLNYMSCGVFFLLTELHPISSEKYWLTAPNPFRWNLQMNVYTLFTV